MPGQDGISPQSFRRLASTGVPGSPSVGPQEKGRGVGSSCLPGTGSREGQEKSAAPEGR